MAILIDDHHLVSTTCIEDLHSFAATIGMKQSWFQNHRFPHYDILSATKRSLAFRLGAQLVTSREIVKRSIRGPVDEDGFKGFIRVRGPLAKDIAIRPDRNTNALQ